jgi:hypothetical protein
MTMVALAVALGSVTEAAVMVTVFPAGTEAGAAYVVAAELALVVGFSEPQAVEMPQETVQVTPALAVSLATVAAMLAVPLTFRDAGGAVLSMTVMLLMVMAAVLALTLESSATVAVMTTPAGGIVAGAV